MANAEFVLSGFMRREFIEYYAHSYDEESHNHTCCMRSSHNIIYYILSEC